EYYCGAWDSGLNTVLF
nr:immunoglobulin light chain junction region [Macaca mulatta]